VCFHRPTARAQVRDATTGRGGEPQTGGSAHARNKGDPEQNQPKLRGRERSRHDDARRQGRQQRSAAPGKDDEGGKRDVAVAVSAIDRCH
jgi:hypothetical protein